MADAVSISSASAAAEQFLLKDFRLQCGSILPEAKLVFKTYGTLNQERSNVILYPTSYGAHHSDIDWLIGPERILDSSRYFVVIPNMFGNGLSTSPSNTDGGYTPPFSHVDNVTAQRRMLDEVFGIRRLALAYGWSMGAQQALHWGSMFPDAVERIVAVCGTAKTTPHNWVFLDGLRSILMADEAWAHDHFLHRPEKALKAFGRVYAGWALSQAFYREQIHLELGYESLEDFLTRDWEASFLRRDAGNLLSMIDTWKRSDISDNDTFRGDIGLALRSITAKTYIIPGQTDLYFTPDDCKSEAEQIPHATYLPIPSIWGHRAGNPAKNPIDQKLLQSAVTEILHA